MLTFSLRLGAFAFFGGGIGSASEHRKVTRDWSVSNMSHHA